MEFMKNLTTILILPAMLFSACGAMKKIKDKTSIREQTEQLEAESSETINTHLQRFWSKDWFQEQQLLNAVILSDSTIRFRPNEGFSVSGGAVWIQQNINSSQSRNERMEEMDQQNINVAGTKSLKTKKDEEKLVIDKERNRPDPIILFVLIAGLLAITFLYRRIKASR